MSTSTLQKPAVTAEPTLTKADRCDSCGSQAFASATFLNGVLLFCGHHFTRFNEKISSSAISVVDERAFVLPDRTVGGNGFV